MTPRSVQIWYSMILKESFDFPVTQVLTLTSGSNLVTDILDITQFINTFDKGIHVFKYYAELKSLKYGYIGETIVLSKIKLVHIYHCVVEYMLLLLKYISSYHDPTGTFDIPTKVKEINLVLFRFIPLFTSSGLEITPLMKYNIRCSTMCWFSEDTRHFCTHSYPYKKKGLLRKLCIFHRIQYKDLFEIVEKYINATDLTNLVLDYVWMLPR